MTHFWLRAEHRPTEARSPLTPEGAAALVRAGAQVTVERSDTRVFALADFEGAGCAVAEAGSWPDAPADAVVLGLKELPQDDTPLRHNHIMFGHAYKGQPAGQALLKRFARGGGTLLDLEYLTDDAGARLAAFGHWAGFIGAGVALKGWAAQKQGGLCGPLTAYDSQAALVEDVNSDLGAAGGIRPDAIVIGALGRTGRGAAALFEQAGVAVTKWDMDETEVGAPFPQIRSHDLFLNCILAGPETPVFVPADTVTAPRRLSVIADIACDPTSDFSPVKVYDRPTSWEQPARRVHDTPPLDVMAIDNLPSLLPRESSKDFAAQLLPLLMALQTGEGLDPWARTREAFDTHVAAQAPAS